MICISVTPESRKLAKVDLLNASRQGDLIELCLDHLIKPPDMKDLITAVDKPILVSCRRPEEGGKWNGTDDQRMTLLREAIVAEPAYIELDIETAHKIPRFGATKRVISHTSLKKPLSKVDTVFERAVNAKADVVKFTWPTPTLEAAWPLLAAVTQKRDLPIVGLGLGPAGLTFSLLARKFGSPWVYAALERGMEAFYGQPSCHDLDDIHKFRDIGKGTRFVGVVGFDEAELTTARLFNEAAQKSGVDARCLPMTSNDPAKLKQMFDILKVNAILGSDQLDAQIGELAEHRDEVARECQFADFFVKQQEGWTAYNTGWRNALIALENAMGKTSKDERPLDRRNILVVGSGPLARTFVYGITKRKGMVSVASGDDDEAQRLAQATGARFVSTATMYDTFADVVVLATPNLKPGPGKGQLNPSYLRPPMVVMDVASMPEDSPLIKEARERGVTVVDPADIYTERLASQFKSVTGKDVSASELRQALDA
jgi:3-dehydroquinate dehydratase / shikimate dehydrogenase